MAMEEMYIQDHPSIQNLLIQKHHNSYDELLQYPSTLKLVYNLDYENGEYMNADSITLPDSLQFETLNSQRTVYGGGGIYPDIFIPNDTAGASYYLTTLYYAGAFNHYAIKYLDTKRGSFTNMAKFVRGFKVSATMFESFIAYATTLGVEEIPFDIVSSRGVIKNRIKAEIARHVWQEDGYYSVYLSDDLDVQKALSEFRKSGSLLSHVRD